MIKIFIFDLDGTLYSSKSDLYVVMSKLIRDWFIVQFDVKEDYEKIFFENLKCSHPSAIEAIYKYELSIKNFHEHVFEDLNPDLYLSEDKQLQYILSNLSGHKFLVTLSSQKYSRKVLDALGISQYFFRIYNPGINWHTCKKVDVYEMIRKEFKLASNELCIIGDNYAVDIADAKILGYKCILLSDNVTDIPTITNIKQFSTVFI